MEDRFYKPYPWDTTSPCPSQSSNTIPVNPIPCGNGSSADLPPIKFYPGARIGCNFDFDWNSLLVVEPLFKVKLLHSKAKVPTKAYEDDLGWDIYAIKPDTLWHGHLTWIQTGIAIQPRKGWGYKIWDRTSMAGQDVFTHGGVIDRGYRGEVHVGLTCETPQYYITEGQRIAQIVFIPIAEDGPVVVDELDPSEKRDTRGFGSSGR